MSCTHSGAVLEPIYWRMDRQPDGSFKTMRRAVVAEVAYCYACGVPVGDVHSLSSPKINGEDWQRMLGLHPKPPYVFLLIDGALVPEGVDLVAYRKSNIMEPRRVAAPQDRAANDHGEEPERELED